MATSPSDSRLGARSGSPSIGIVSRRSFVNHPSSSIPTSLSLNTASPRFFTASSHSVLTLSGVVSDGFPPSGAHASSPHTSQAGGPLYYSGHMTGSWPTPGLSQPSSYTYGTSGSGTSGSGPLAQPPYSRTPAPYGSAQSPSHHHFPGRATSSAQNAESIPAPQSYQDHQQPFPSPVGVGGAGNGSGGLGSPLSAQGGNQSGLAQPILGNQTHNTTRQTAPGQNTGTGPVTTQDGSSYRQPPTPSGYYPHTSASQQPPFPSYAPPGTQPSPTSASSATAPGSVPRGASSIPAMAPPLQYSGGRANSVPSMPSYASYNTGPVLSNMHHPGAPLAMVGSMSGLPSYSHHPGLSPHHPHPLYVHHPGGPTPQSERPFKCNECQQAFNRNHDLKRHQRIHLAVKPFGCGDCEKRFSRKDALKRHRLVKGCGGTSPPNAAGTNTGSKEVTSDDRGAIASADKDTSPRSMKREP